MRSKHRDLVVVDDTPGETDLRTYGLSESKNDNGAALIALPIRLSRWPHDRSVVRDETSVQSRLKNVTKKKPNHQALASNRRSHR